MILGSILRDILEAEKRAKELDAQAEKYKADAAAEIEREAEKLTAEKLKEAEEEIARLRAEYEKSAEESVKSAESEGHAVSEKFSVMEREKSAEWIDAVFNRVISDEA